MRSRTATGSIGTRKCLTVGVGLVAGLWASLLVATPYLMAHPHSRQARLAAAAVYLVGGVLCHQRSERSFHVWDRQVPVCARCSGLYVGAPLGIVGVFARRRSSDRRLQTARHFWPLRRLRTILIAAAVPTLVTVAVEVMGIAEPTNLVRAVSALPLGCGIAWVVGLSLTGGVDEEA